MARSTRPPIKDDGTLKNECDELLLAALAVGLTIEAYVRDGHYESKEGATRGLQRLIATLQGKDRYAVLVWVMNRKLLDLVVLTRYAPDAYPTWVGVYEALETNPLGPDQVDLLISYVGIHHNTIHTHWSHPDRYPEIERLLNQVGLPATGQTAYAVVLSAAAYRGDISFEAIPGQGASMFRTPAGVMITLSGPPGAVHQALKIIRAALGLKEWPDVTTGPAD